MVAMVCKNTYAKFSAKYFCCRCIVIENLVELPVGSAANCKVCAVILFFNNERGRTTFYHQVCDSERLMAQFSLKMSCIPVSNEPSRCLNHYIFAPSTRNCKIISLYRKIESWLSFFLQFYCWWNQMKSQRLRADLYFAVSNFLVGI